MIKDTLLKKNGTKLRRVSKTQEIIFACSLSLDLRQSELKKNCISILDFDTLK